MAALEDLEHDPKSLEDAQSRSDWPRWKEGSHGRRDRHVREDRNVDYVYPPKAKYT